MTNSQDPPGGHRMIAHQERIDLLETQVKVLFAMVYCQGRGLTSLFQCFGIDPKAACADLEADVPS